MIEKSTFFRKKLRNVEETHPGKIVGKISLPREDSYSLKPGISSNTDWYNREKRAMYSTAFPVAV